MERESFEDEATAAILNNHFVCIKVDREERPDVDEAYMKAVQMMTGSGGWPLSVFLTPQGAPFYGGTYFPPTSMYGRPSFQQVLLAIAQAWRDKRRKLLESAQKVTDSLIKLEMTGSLKVPTATRTADAAKPLRRCPAPKKVAWRIRSSPRFRSPARSRFGELRAARVTGHAMVTATLVAAATGGITATLAAAPATRPIGVAVPRFEVLCVRHCWAVSTFRRSGGRPRRHTSVARGLRLRAAY